MAKTENDAVNFAFTFPDLKGKDGSDAEVGVIPKGNGSYDYIPIYTIVNAPVNGPSPIYRTRNGETLKTAAGGLMYLTLNNVAVSQPIPISVANGSSSQIVPVMLSGRALSASGNTTWSQYYIDIRITTFNGVITPRIVGLFNSNMVSVALSSTQLDSCKLIGTIYGVFE